MLTLVPKYRIGQPVRVNNDSIEKTKMGYITGIKFSEEKKADGEVTRTFQTFVYSLSNDSSWYYERSLVPMQDATLTEE